MSDRKTTTPKTDTTEESNVLLANAFGSAFAGIVSRIFTHPIDTAKSRLQAQYTTTTNSLSTSTSGIRYNGTYDVLSRTFRSEGIRGLYRGFGAILVGGTPGTVTYLCTYEMAKENLSRFKQKTLDEDESNGGGGGGGGGDFVVHFCSGMIAETIACIIYVPVDVIKERLQVQHSTTVGNAGGGASYNGSLDAFKKIAKAEGLSGIYKGYAATLGSFGPFSALYFMFYERCKSEARQYLYYDPNRPEPKATINNKELPFHWVVLCSATAGAVASWLTSPLDMAKLRLQVQRGARYHLEKTASATSSASSTSSLVEYRGVVDCLQAAYREGGVHGLFRGAGARVCFYAPATTITMSCYESCRSLVAKFLASD